MIEAISIGNLLGNLANFHGMRKNSAAARQAMIQEQERNRALDAREEQMRRLRDEELANYGNLDAKIRSAEDDANNKFNENIAPYIDDQRRRISDPENYYAERAEKANRDPRYGGDARMGTGILNMYSPKNSSSANEELQSAIRGIGERAAKGYDSETYARDKDAYSTLVNNHKSNLDHIGRPREEALRRMALRNNLSAQNIDMLRNAHARDNSTSKNMLDVEMASNMNVPQAINDLTNTLGDHYDEVQRSNMHNMQMKKLNADMKARDEIINSNIQRFKKKKGKKMIINDLFMQ